MYCLYGWIDLHYLAIFCVFKLLSSLPSLACLIPWQIEDLSQQVHKAAAEKFKVPLEPSPLIPDVTPSLTIKEESEEEEVGSSVCNSVLSITLLQAPSSLVMPFLSL